MDNDSKMLFEAYASINEGLKKAIKGGALGAAGGALAGGIAGGMAGASKGAATTSWVPPIGPGVAIKAGAAGVGGTLGAIAGAKKGAAIGGLGGAGVGAMMDDEDAENIKSLDSIGDKPMHKEEARQIADKYTNWSHEELMKMSTAYRNGFSHELQGIADDNEYKENTFNYYMYEFGQYEALTSH